MDGSLKKTISGTLGTGMGFLFGAKNDFYTLTHRVSSQYHQAGEVQKIIVDSIQIGRGEECEVRFDENFPTVSRRHAGIVREGNQWKLVHLSATNSTLLNGQKIQKEVYLRSGDEIQLSINGPKLGFKLSSSKGGHTIGMTDRMSLFREQAMKPYRMVLIIFAVLLALLIAGGVVYGVKAHKKNTELNELVLKQQKEIIAHQQKLEEATNRLIDLTEQVDKAKAETLKAKQNAIAAKKKALESEELTKDVLEQMDELTLQLQLLQEEALRSTYQESVPEDNQEDDQEHYQEDNQEDIQEYKDIQEYIQEYN